MKKKLTEAELIERDSKRDIDEEVRQALREIKVEKFGRVFLFEDGKSTQVPPKYRLH